MFSLGHIRNCCDLLASHAMLALGNNDVSTWRDDVLAMARLGRMIARAPNILQALVGLALIQKSIDVTTGSLPRLTLTQTRELLAEWRKLPPLPDIVDCDDQCQRLDTIGEICLMARFGPVADSIDHSDPTIPLPTPVSFGFQPPIHFDDLLRQFNELYDRRVAAERVPKYSRRLAAMAAFEAERAGLAAKATGKSSTAAIQRLMYFALSGTDKHRLIQDKAEERGRLVELALLMVAYRGDHGAYPKSWNELADAAPARGDLFADDQPVRFVPASSTLYSVGPNQRDDGGIYAPPKPIGLSFSFSFDTPPAPVMDYPDDIALHLP
jgi:hypothetical protein